MNNRILATLFALAVALFIGVAPVKAEAAHTHVDRDNNYLCDRCREHVHHMTEIEAIEPTCTEAGREAHYYCAGCKYLFTDAEGKNQVWSTELVIPATGHDYVWTYDEDEHVKTCANCGQTFHEAHILTYTDNKDGTHTATCSKCDYEKTEEHYDKNGNDSCDPCNAVVHNLKFVEKVEATCTNEGREAHYECQNCGHWFKDELAAEQVTYPECVIEAKGHDLYRVSSGVGTGKHVVLCHDCDYNGGEWDCKDLYDTTEADCICDLCGELIPHVWDGPTMDYHAAKAATCGEPGNPEYEECTICGTWIRYDGSVITEAEKVIPATGHTEAGWWNNDATGHWHRCKVCGVKMTTEEHTFEWVSDGEQHWQRCTVCGYETEKEGHDWDRVSNGDGTHTTKCTKCTAVKGNQTWQCTDSPDDDDCVCDGCGGPVEHDKTQMNAHAPVAATCTETGMRGYWDCPFCGKLFVDGKDGKLEEVTDVTTEALGHDWKYVKDTLNGQHLQKCKRCGAYQTFGHVDSNGDCLCDIGGCNTPVHSHTYIHVARVEPTCGKEGTEEYLKYEGCGKMFDMDRNPIDAPAVIPALEHEWSEEWEVVEDGHAKKCVNCGALQAAEAHTDSNGDNRCDVCKVELTLDHVPQQDPTCTDIGYKEYWISPITGRMYADPNGKEFITARETIPAAGHSYTISDGIYHVCDVCGHTQKHVADADYPCFCSICHLPLSGHEMAFVDTVVATCTKPGTKAYLECSCGRLYDVMTGEEISAPISIPAIGHKLSSELVEDTRQGDHYQVCVHAGCDYEYHSEHEYEAEDPLKGNYHQFICACGHVETEVHYDEDGDNKCDECGHDMANTTVQVEQHDSVTVITGEKDTVDNTKTWWQNWWGNITSSNAGSETSGNTTTTTFGSGSTTAGSSSGTSTGTPAASDGSTTTSGGSSNSGSGNTGSTSGSASSTSGSGTSSAIDQLILFLTELLNKLITIR